ncbi:acyl-CoA dehydrogenase [Diaphorobacter caeni]|uniref:acyl-CoA dehydrogenase n=1 Tax=Diaphorobacter caeni TaxID=2784387 RepID=UPI00188E00AE|nr:acyl-CoA dehydrogenase [Diaphorobacter caeni]MBF5006739.1 acyl-CoA dehydrogenase [Diaphorobacter caeni]
MSNSYSAMWEAALADFCGDERVRAVEAGDGQSAAALWAEIEALGYTDALVSSERGGAGLGLAHVEPLVFAAARAGVSHPWGETMVARALLSRTDWTSDGSCIALASAVSHRDDAELVCADIPGALLASQVLVDDGEQWLLMPVSAAQCTPGVYRPHVSAALRWKGADSAITRFAKKPDESAANFCNALHASAMGGTMARVLDLSVLYANDRRQFGRAIGQFQAIQQDLAVLAEQAGMAALAARMGCATAGIQPDRLLSASAKLNACDAALRVATLAHAVHGAIGITQEHMLGIFTARLHELRASADTDADCAEQLGNAVLDSPLTLCDFMRESLAPTPVEEV